MSDDVRYDADNDRFVRASLYEREKARADAAEANALAVAQERLEERVHRERDWDAQKKALATANARADAAEDARHAEEEKRLFAELALTREQKCRDAADDALAAARREREEMREALGGLMKLIDEGVIVRNVIDDGKPGWALKAMSLVLALKHAHAALGDAALATPAPAQGAETRIADLERKFHAQRAMVEAAHVAFHEVAGVAYGHTPAEDNPAAMIRLVAARDQARIAELERLADERLTSNARLAAQLRDAEHAHETNWCPERVRFAARIAELEAALRRAHGEGCVCVTCEKLAARTSPQEDR